MRILNRYLARDFWVIFLLTFAILTFVMSLGALLRAIDLVSRGASAVAIAKVFLYNMPFAMVFTFPMSTLTAVLLQFGRLSMEGELTAMRACGVSLWEIIAPVILSSIVLSMFCVYISADLAPRLFHERRKVLVNLGGQDPTALIEEGRFIREFPGYMIYVSEKRKDTFQDMILYELSHGGFKRHIRADSGTMKIDGESGLLRIDLYGVKIDQPDEKYPHDVTKSRYIVADHYPIDFDLDRLMNRGEAVKKVSDMTLHELIRAIRNIREAYPELRAEDRGKERMELIVQANKRLTLSIACFALTVLAIPLGMKSKRKESSVGIGISLAVILVFYLFIILAESFAEQPHLRPDLFIWTPVVLAEVIGFILLKRAE
jgi:lipopolysaccharide export system permease protein